MIIDSTEFSDSNCDTFGYMLEEAYKVNMDITVVMEMMFNDYYCASILCDNLAFEWCDPNVMLDTVIHRYNKIYNAKFPLLQQKYERYIDMWYAGYLYKYWVDSMNLNWSMAPIILEILPWKEYMRRESRYAYDGPYYSIEDATKRYFEDIMDLKRRDKIGNINELTNHYEITSDNVDIGYMQPILISAKTPEEAIDEYCKKFNIKNKPVQLNDSIKFHIEADGYTEYEINCLPSLKLIDFFYKKIRQVFILEFHTRKVQIQGGINTGE
jgi:hypothetical protein